jgi:1,4-alpha-glucan branching enzyme
MITKQLTPKKTIAKVTFKLPAEWVTESASVVGDFNNWDPTVNKLEKKNGGWETEVKLKPNAEYQFRYLVDGTKWINDDAADKYVPNEYGSENSVVVVTA